MQPLLLVEDEALIQDLISGALAEAGYEVVSCREGAKALAELEADAGRFIGLITDIKLGAGPDGWDLAHRARELSPTIPVVYMSGDSSADWSAKGVPNSLMINKPFAVAQIVTAISTLIVQESTRGGGPQA